MLKLFSKAKTATSSGPRPRAPRDNIACSATLCAGNAFLRVHLCDVSSSGCKIDVPHPIAVGEKVQIALQSFHSLSGTVRWCREGTAGIQFARPLSDAGLKGWKDAIANGPAAPEVVDDGPKRKRNFLGERMYEGG
jgi:hypothetical protein